MTPAGGVEEHCVRRQTSALARFVDAQDAQA